MACNCVACTRRRAIRQFERYDKEEEMTRDAKKKHHVKETIEKVTFEQLKAHALTSGLIMDQFRDLAAELTENAPLVLEQPWPENVRKVLHEAILTMADMIKQSIAIVEHVAQVIDETPVPTGEADK